MPDPGAAGRLEAERAARIHCFEEAAAFARERRVTIVDLKFCDLAGRWRHVTLPAERFTPVLMEDGVGIDGSSVGLRSVKSGDLVLVPDLATGVLDPFPEELIPRWIAKKREEDREVRNRPHPYEIELYYDL